MKKFSFLISILLLTVVITFLFMGCQKESTSATENDGLENTNIKAVAGSGSFLGSIDGSYAAALQGNFAKKYTDDNQTLQVAFSAKDLAAFINSLQAKYKSDIIYVNFGIYGKSAPALNSKDNGRMTVFFTGNNISNTTGNVKTDAESSDAYLNHGQIYP